MAPLTVDNAVIDLLLDTVEPGTLPTPGTGLNHALGLAAELFPQGSESHRVIVLLSDGEDHEGGLDDGIRQLAEQGIVAHALGIGTPQGAPLPVPGGGANELKRDRDGKIVVSRLGEDALRRLASLTDGTYLQITDAGDDLGVVLDAIDQMDRRGFSAETIEAQEDRFQWPLALAAICLLLFLVTAPVATSREPTA